MRLVQDTREEHAIRLCHAGAAGFLSQLLLYEEGAGIDRYEAARKMEEFAGHLVDAAAVLVVAAENGEAREPGNL